mmetsp:Transcript_7903/g.22804  ORF Transcript_7903/g.22804 Transcript_7903/m.22804 type:complete len:480 (+) Transcript_7903:104-1543(+)
MTRLVGVHHQRCLQVKALDFVVIEHVTDTDLLPLGTRPQDSVKRRQQCTELFLLAVLFAPGLDLRFELLASKIFLIFREFLCRFTLAELLQRLVLLFLHVIVTLVHGRLNIGALSDRIGWVQRNSSFLLLGNAVARSRRSRGRPERCSLLDFHPALIDVIPDTIGSRFLGGVLSLEFFDTRLVWLRGSHRSPEGGGGGGGVMQHPIRVCCSRCRGISKVHQRCFLLLCCWALLLLHMALLRWASRRRTWLLVLLLLLLMGRWLTWGRGGSWWSWRADVLLRCHGGSSWRRGAVRRRWGGWRDDAAATMLQIEVIVDAHQVQQFERQHGHGRSGIGATRIFARNRSHGLAHHFESPFGCLGGSVGRRNGLGRRKQQLAQIVLRGSFDRELRLGILDIPPAVRPLSTGRPGLVLHKDSPVVPFRSQMAQGVSRGAVLLHCGQSWAVAKGHAETVEQRIPAVGFGVGDSVQDQDGFVGIHDE